MYEYKSDTHYSREDILERVSEELIFKTIFFQEGVELHTKMYKSPFREDGSPDCWFWEGDNGLFFVDMGSRLTRTHFDFIGLVSVTYNYNYKESLDFISIKLGLSEGVVNGVIVKKKPKKKVEISPIVSFRRNFQVRDKIFWYDRYGISKEDLVEDKVYPISAYVFKSNKGDNILIEPKDITYSYEEFDSKSKIKKIYRPKASKKAKWLSNLNKNCLTGMSKLNYAYEQLVLTKSYKDYRVLYNLKVNSLGLQNETVKPDSEEFIEAIQFFKEIIIWFDNDEAGIQGAINLKEYLSKYTDIEKIRLVHLPVELLEDNIKDPSDLKYKQGEEELLNFIKTHKIKTSWQQLEI